MCAAVPQDFFLSIKPAQRSSGSAAEERHTVGALPIRMKGWHAPAIWGRPGETLRLVCSVGECLAPAFYPNELDCLPTHGGKSEGDAAQWPTQLPAVRWNGLFVYLRAFACSHSAHVGALGSFNRSIWMKLACDCSDSTKPKKRRGRKWRDWPDVWPLIWLQIWCVST